ncbi:hypothetical protein WJX81_007832 [Elliptochloris bilobata]|uniref:Glycerophosphocholine acyltransferase 1 n=1 Tax=Elliptochloris bilobata TaxID=381761 RepID=A0AAW1RK27_9CHLO
MHQVRSRHPPRRRTKEREAEARAAPVAEAQTRHGSPTLRAIVEASHVSAVASYRAAKAPPPTTLFTMGVAIYGALLYIAGAAPALLPALYLLFAAISGPWRAWDFLRRKHAFFLIDFCYVVNVATVVALATRTQDARVLAMLYSLADGPLAAALIAWQCSWVFSSPSHSISVLLHLLPGLALFVYRHMNAPMSIEGVVQHISSLLPGRGHLAACAPIAGLPVDAPVPNLMWTFVAPMLFYCAWQLCYFVFVQIVFRKFILVHEYETSYRALARRAARTNNFWNRLVRKGSAMRRCATFGAVQAVFTLITLAAAVLVSQSVYLGLAWQVVKFATPVYYGARKSIGSALR